MDPTTSQYHPFLTPPPGHHDPSSLPFTGMDLFIVVGVALILVGLGYLLRRAAR